MLSMTCEEMGVQQASAADASVADKVIGDVDEAAYVGGDDVIVAAGSPDTVARGVQNVAISKPGVVDAFSSREMTFAIFHREEMEEEEEEEKEEGKRETSF